MSLDDDQLLDALNRAIGPDLEARPSPAERDALRQVVLQAGRTTSAAADTTGTAGPTAPVVSITSARRWRHRVAAGAVAGVVALSGATAVAAATNNGALPAPVRTVARAVGLPVDSSALADAKDALRRLRQAKDDDVAEAITRVGKTLAALSTGERTGMQAESNQVLADARARLAAITAATSSTTTPTTNVPGTSTPSANGSTAASSGSSRPSTGTSTATTVDDKGGRSDTGGQGGDGTGGDDHGGSSVAGSTATTDDSGSGKGSGGGSTGGGSDDGASTSLGTTATTEAGGSGKGGGSNGGGDSTAVTTKSTTATTDKPKDASATATTDTTADSHGGSSKGGGGSNS